MRFVNKSRNHDKVTKYRDFCVVTMVKALSTKALKQETTTSTDDERPARHQQGGDPYDPVAEPAGHVGPQRGALPCLT